MKYSMAVKFAGLIGIFASLFGLCSVLAATFLAGNDFNWNRNALSDIGVSTVSIAANVFNISLVLTGVLDFVFALGFTKANARNALFYVGDLLLVIGGISLSLIGIFTEAYGILHFYVSAGYFGFTSLAIILIGFAFRKAQRATRGNVSILIGLIAALTMLGGTFAEWHVLLGLGFAVPEFIASLVFAAWTIWMGYSLLATGNQPARFGKP